MARLLSVNVGLPRDIAWRGKTVHTAIWKDPVQGRRMVRRLNIDGDGQGDLTGSRRRASGGLCLPDRVVSVLAGSTRPKRFHLRTVRGELHR